MGGATLGIALEDLPESGHDRTSLWFYVDDVDDSYRRALEAGASPHSEPTNMPWGERMGQVRDPDGLTINLGAET